jgi:hypothetical protein
MSWEGARQQEESERKKYRKGRKIITDPGNGLPRASTSGWLGPQ